MKKITSFSSFILLALFLFSNLTFSQSPTVQSVTSFTDEGTLKIGDYVLVHVGFAIQKIDEVEAKKTQMSYNKQKLTRRSLFCFPISAGSLSRLASLRFRD